MAILNYTTKIDPDKTAGEIAKMLSMAGAKAVLTEYDDKENYVSALSFKLVVNGQELGIKLPCDWKPILEILENDRKVPRHLITREQAVKVAWRIVKDWIEAQLAIIQTKMVRTEEVFLPYIITKSGQTLFEQISNNKFLLGPENK
jgi:hypothetical protein